MASKKKNSRRGGHPANEANRREQEKARREASANPLRRLASTCCRDAEMLQTALDAELWASELLGSWWPASLEFKVSGLEPDNEYGKPIVEELARIGSVGALAALIAFSELSEVDLSLVARKNADKLIAAGVAPPVWASAIAEPQVLRIAVMREKTFDDGITIFIEAEHDGGDRHAIGIYIDHNIGVCAKDILITESIDSVEQTIANADQEGHDVLIESIESGEACSRICAAMDRTDMTLDPFVGDDYAGLRSLALRRAAELSGGRIDVSNPEVSSEERERLSSDFLSSQEGSTFKAESNEAFIVSLAIDFCADYVDGRPLRWSPSLVEIFMLGWLPEKVLADRATFEAAPAALDAWVQYAGRARKIPEWAIDETTAAVERFTQEMLAIRDDPGEMSPSMEFLTAAKSAGLDLENEQEMSNFIAGWNARSEIDL